LEKLFIAELYNRNALFADEAILGGVITKWKEI
jgi:hypothetical protein